jgi:hypothetical protein
MTRKWMSLLDRDLSIPLIAPHPPPPTPTFRKFFADKLIIKFPSLPLSLGGIVKDFNYISVTKKDFSNSHSLCLSGGFSFWSVSSASKKKVELKQQWHQESFCKTDNKVPPPRHHPSDC